MKQRDLCKSSSTDHSKDDSSKPAPEKSPPENNVSDDQTHLLRL